MDFDSFVTLASVLLVPASIVFIILTILRVRRSKFHRQRITKKNGKVS